MKKLSKSSANHLKTSDNDVKKTLTLNLAHMLFLHSLLRSIPTVDLPETEMKRFVHDLTFLLEIYIDGVDDDKLKKQFDYKPENS